MDRLAPLTDAWSREGARGADFARALRNWVDNLRNQGTRQNYVLSIAEWSDWTAATYGALWLPDRVERSHAARFVTWLLQRTERPVADRLRREGRVLEAAVADLVQATPGIAYDDLRRRLLLRPELTTTGPRGERVLLVDTTGSDLDRTLACMTKQHLVERTPTITELRKLDPTLLSRLNERIDPAVFSYRPVRITTQPGPDRANSTLLYVTALASFWKSMTKGENTGGGEPLLRFDVWREQAPQLSRQAKSHKRVRRIARTPSQDLYEQLVQTTYADGVPSTTLDNIRDRAILSTLRWTGLRVSEIGSLRRSSISGDPPLLEVVGKGGKRRNFALPKPVQGVLNELTAKLTELAIQAGPRLLEPDAPLFPSMRWGCPATQARRHSVDRGLTRAAIGSMLRRRGLAAGIDAADLPRMHPHGFRRLAAKSAVDSGVPLHVVQAVLGHDTISQTGEYIDTHDPKDLNLHVPARGAPSAPVVVVPTLAPPVRSAPSPPSPAPPPAPPKPPVVHVPVVPPVPDAVPPPKAVPASPAIEEHLVAVGHVAEATDPLAVVYTKERWGEAGGGRRRAMHPAGKSDGGRGYDLLSTTYVGKATGLPWWAGPRNLLRPELPVISPSQAMGETGPYGSVRDGLEALWLRWVSDTGSLERGPTAAHALLEWFRTSLTLSDLCTREVSAAEGGWVAYTAPMDATAAKTNVLREHRGDKVVAWFEERANTFLVARGSAAHGTEAARMGQVIDEADAGADHGPVADVLRYVTVTDAEGQPVVGEDGKPVRKQLRKREALSWYQDEDPVKSLPPDERKDLLDWLLVLTGKPPADTTPRFHRGGTELSVSRVDVAKLLGAMCAYDGMRTELGRLIHDKALETDIQRAKDAVNATARTASKLAKELVTGKPVVGDPVRDEGLAEDLRKTFDLRALVDVRAKATRVTLTGTAGSDVAKRSSTRTFYMTTVAKLLGDTAIERDEYLRTFALCAVSQPLRRRSAPGAGDYADLFHVDVSRETIVHTDEYKRAFARATGQHSECVARRMARHLWELRKEGSRVTERSDELVAQLAAWAYWRVPCHASAERELRTMLDGAPPSPLLAAFRTPIALRQREGLEAHDTTPMATSLVGMDGPAMAELFVEIGPERVSALLAGAAMKERLRAKAVLARLASRDSATWTEVAEEAEYLQNARSAAVEVYERNGRAFLPSPIVAITWVGA